MTVQELKEIINDWLVKSDNEHWKYNTINKCFYVLKI